MFYKNLNCQNLNSHVIQKTIDIIIQTYKISASIKSQFPGNV